MVRWAAVVGFAVAVLPICLTPGTSFTLVTGRVLAKGRRSGVLVAAGTACGILCHATLAGIGLAALVMRSSEAFLVVKLVGAGYLVVLGLTTLVKARRATKAAEVKPIHSGRRLPWMGRSDFVQGWVGNVLNPKAAAVYLTLAPQFVGAGSGVLGQLLVLAAAHVVVAVVPERGRVRDGGRAGGAGRADRRHVLTGAGLTRGRRSRAVPGGRRARAGRAGPARRAPGRRRRT